MSEFMGMRAVTDERVRQGYVVFACWAAGIDLDDVVESEVMVDDEYRATVSIKVRPKIDWVIIDLVSVPIES